MNAFFVDSSLHMSYMNSRLINLDMDLVRFFLNRFFSFLHDYFLFFENNVIT